MGQAISMKGIETKYLNMDQVKFVKDSLAKILNNKVCLNRQYHFNFYKYCFPQISRDPFLNNTSPIYVCE